MKVDSGGGGFPGGGRGLRTATGSRRLRYPHLIDRRRARRVVRSSRALPRCCQGRDQTKAPRYGLGMGAVRGALRMAGVALRAASEPAPWTLRRFMTTPCMRPSPRPSLGRQSSENVEKCPLLMRTKHPGRRTYLRFRPGHRSGGKSSCSTTTSTIAVAIVTGAYERRLCRENVRSRFEVGLYSAS